MNCIPICVHCDPCINFKIPSRRKVDHHYLLLGIYYSFQTIGTLMFFFFNGITYNTRNSQNLESKEIVIKYQFAVRYSKIKYNIIILLVLLY